MTHQQLCAKSAGTVGVLRALVVSARNGCRPGTVTETRQRLGAIEAALGALEARLRQAGAMSEDCREAFEGAAR